MIIFSGCKMKTFNVKEKEICLNLTISNSNIKGNSDSIQDLLTLKNEDFNLALAPEIEKEDFEKELRQLDFEIRCPDCHSYDVRVGEKIGFCVDCKKEFYKFRPDAYFKIEKVEKLRP